jgi:hypothetical protein
VRHEFGDTRHRDLRYDLVAVSRFHEFFPAAELGEDAFTARTELPDPHSIPSSARPPAPVVDALVPTVRWEGDAPRAGWTKIRRTRLGDGVRIYLDRPWYASGDGELLALLLPEGDEGPAPEVAPLMTAWGADPIWKAPEEFAGGPLVADELAATAGDPVTQLPLVDRPGTVTAIPYAVEWNAERGRWYADVELAGSDETNYAPFLRLGLARYQPNSISPDVALSAPVDGGFVQLLPVRRLTADRHPDGTITVTIDGPAPAGPDHNWLELSIEVQGDQPSGELGWQPWSERVPTLVAMDAMPVRAAVAAPGDVQGRFRLVVREYERHPADTEVADGRGDGTTRDRVVFAEVLAL